ncbi:peroxidase P7 [Canna indica]|uniref:Peroxidase n=1 Tax=Canna indica TaxID=4628 RepID=A0AAQ3QI55_9LILI|nr:peroxidase P7 [Canna indica]
MAKFCNDFAVLGFLSLLSCAAINAQLSPTFYSSSCPNLHSIVRSGMAQAVNRERRLGASILRLFFHDCFGCDGSILLDDTATFTGEKNAGPNANSVRGFEVIDAIKSNVEAACPGTVSCADILALAARDGVVLLGGQTWTVPLGRRDATTASQSAANSNLASSASSLSQLISIFAAKGLNARDMTALSGAHTVGQARCVSFRSRIYNDAKTNASFFACIANGQLSPGFYRRTCPTLESTVKSAMTQAVNNEHRMGASILRLFFHDCFVNGCDASILLDDTATFTGEKNARPNAKSVRGYEVIDTIKSNVESACPGVVSCADIVALAARDGVVLVSLSLSLSIYIYIYIYIGS